MKQIFFKFLTAVIVLSVLALLSEFAAIAGYVIRDRAFFSIADTMKREGNIYVESRDGYVKQRKDAGSFFGMNIINPYWAYTKHSIPPLGVAVNRQGFTGRDFLPEKEPGVFTIMISGGSVANAFFNGIGARQLQADLNAHFTNESIHQFVILNGAQDGWKEPQQASLLMQHGQGLNGFINLMGWNEQKVIKSPDFIDRLETLPTEFYITLNNYYGSAQSLFFYQADEGLKDWQHKRGFFQKLKALYFLTQRLRNYFRYRAAHDPWLSNKAGEEYLRSQNQLPSDWSKKRRRNFIFDSLRKYIRIENQFGKAMNFKTLFLVQPCVMVGKPLTAEEEAHAKNTDKEKERYLQLAAELLLLKNENIPIFSLLDIFKNTPELVFMDRCHLYDRGNIILKENILRLIEKEWGLVRTK